MLLRFPNYHPAFRSRLFLITLATPHQINPITTNHGKTVSENISIFVADHFPDVGKMIEFGSGAMREIDDVALNPLHQPNHFVVVNKVVML